MKALIDRTRLNFQSGSCYLYRRGDSRINLIYAIDFFAASLRVFFSNLLLSADARSLPFLLVQKSKQKSTHKDTFGFLMYSSLMPTHSQYHSHKRLFQPLLLSTQTEASIAYGNISDAILSLVILPVCF